MEREHTPLLSEWHYVPETHLYLQLLPKELLYQAIRYRDEDIGLRVGETRRALRRATARSFWLRLVLMLSCGALGAFVLAVMGLAWPASASPPCQPHVCDAWISEQWCWNWTYNGTRTVEPVPLYCKYQWGYSVDGLEAGFPFWSWDALQIAAYTYWSYSPKDAPFLNGSACYYNHGRYCRTPESDPRWITDEFDNWGCQPLLYCPLMGPTYDGVARFWTLFCLASLLVIAETASLFLWLPPYPDDCQCANGSG